MRFVLASLASLFFLLGLLLPGRAVAAPRPRLDYYLAWDGHAPRVQVRLVYSPATPDSTVFTFGEPGFGGQTDIFGVVSHIAAVAPDQVLVRAAKRQIVVHHHGPGLHTLTYEVNNGLPAAPPAPTNDDLERLAIRERFRPIVTPSLLYLVSAFLLLQPADHPATTYSMQWDAFPANIPYFFSPAPTARPRQRRVVSRDAHGYFLLVAGPELQVAQQRVQGTPYYLITSRRDSVNHPAQLLAPFLTRYFPAIRDYWHEAPGPYYFLSLLPVRWPSDAPAKAHTMSGFGLDNGFAASYGGPLDPARFSTLIAHETSHSWLGRRLKIGANSFAHQWFGEGFNDYVCLVNLVRAGMLADGFLTYVNEQVLYPHYTSPVRGVPNDSIAAHFWTDVRYKKIPYRRGFLYAFYLDNQIRLATAGRASLRDCLLQLRRRARQLQAHDPEASLGLADFTDVVGQFLPRAQVEQEVTRYMLRGEPLDFHTIRLVPGFAVHYEAQVPVLRLTGAASWADIYPAYDRAALPATP